MTDFRRNLVITLDGEDEGSLLLETLDELNVSIKRWLEKNAPFLRFVQPIEVASRAIPSRPCSAARWSGWRPRKASQENKGLLTRITALKTQYDKRDLCMVDILNRGCTKGAALRRWAEFKGYKPEEVMQSAITITTLRCWNLPDIPTSWGTPPRNFVTADGLKPFVTTKTASPMLSMRCWKD